MKTRLRWIPFVYETSPRRFNTELRHYARSSGAYMIRVKETGEVLYVGESHSNQLYKTITRHVQDRSGKFEAVGEFAHDRPEDLELAIIETDAKKAYEKQQELIDAHCPTMNKKTCARLKDVPF